MVAVAMPTLRRCCGAVYARRKVISSLNEFLLGPQKMRPVALPYHLVLPLLPELSVQRVPQESLEERD